MRVLWKIILRSHWGVYHWCVKNTLCGYMEHWLKYITFYVQQCIASLAMYYNPLLVCENPLRNLDYCLGNKFQQILNEIHTFYPSKCIWKCPSEMAAILFRPHRGNNIRALCFFLITYPECSCISSFRNILTHLCMLYLGCMHGADRQRSKWKDHYISSSGVWLILGSCY